MQSPFVETKKDTLTDRRVTESEEESSEPIGVDRHVR
jgi:hypothetical protein